VGEDFSSWVSYLELDSASVASSKVDCFVFAALSHCPGTESRKLGVVNLKGSMHLICEFSTPLLNPRSLGAHLQKLDMVLACFFDWTSSSTYAVGMC